MDMNALLQGAMQDPAARDFITQLLTQPDPRYAAMAQLAAQPRQGPDFSFMAQPQQASVGDSYDNARGLMDEMLGGFDPEAAAAPAPVPANQPGHLGGPAGAAPGAQPPAPGMAPVAAPGAALPPQVSGPMPLPSPGGFDVNLIDQLLQGMGTGRPSVMGVGPR